MSAKRAKRVVNLGPNPTWYENAIIYEIPIRAFADSNADGIGDINGLISKLGYLEDLGITAIWLLPFYPSPLRDGGYDISDYTSVHPMYGSLADFRRLLLEAHARGIRVITELVINHTSREHPWFQRARISPKGSKWRDFYVWSDSDSDYADARIIFRDFEASNWTWDSVAGQFYWHRFYSHQPDLNFDNPRVHAAVLKALDFWFELGVDGLRLDAIPYLYERDGTNCENLPETHAFLKKLRKHVDDKYSDRMLLAEANQWPEDAAAYFGDADECHMNFHFPLMPRMFMSVQLEDSFPIIDILRQTPEIPAGCQWATFLRNHDELTLEMVTDEDRDYMYRSYAEDPTARLNLGIRRRLAPLLGTRTKVELLNGLLFSLPGTPVLYYGDEIGMGDNIYLGDRDGVRTPMQWSADRNAGFSHANPQKLYLPVITDLEFRYEAVNVQAQEGNSASLLWWMKRIIALYKQHPALARGRLEVLAPDNSRILAFLRESDDETVLVVANLSRFHQWVELDLAAYQGYTPVEMAGVVRFPGITEQPYRLTLSPFGFLWFLLERPDASVAFEGSEPRVKVGRAWTDVFSGSNRQRVAKAMAHWAQHKRWFRAKTQKPRSSALSDVILVDGYPDQALVLLNLEFATGEPRAYFVPVVCLRGDALLDVERRHPSAVIAHVDGLDEPAALVDSVASGSAGPLLLSLVLRNTGGRGGSFRGSANAALRALSEATPSVRAPEFEQTNSVVLFGSDVLLKLYRQVEPGPNVELEIGEFLSKRAPDGPVPQLLGSLTYRADKDRPGAAVAILQRFVPNQGTAWDMTLDRLGSYFDRILAMPDATPPTRRALSARQREQSAELDDATAELVGTYSSDARRLGERTADVHLALASRPASPAFESEPFTSMHQRSLYQWTRALLVKTFAALKKKLTELPEDVRDKVLALLEREAEIDRLLQRVTRTKLRANRIRCHGDLHLGQVLHTGGDFVIIDFEGEPARSLAERAYKRCPLRDVMGMIRSFNYATESTLRGGRYRSQDIVKLQPWARAWEDLISESYLHAYLAAVAEANFIPSQVEHIDLLLSFYGIEKAIYEIAYEMDNRPDWLPIPVTGLETLLETPG